MPGTSLKNAMAQVLLSKFCEIPQKNLFIGVWMTASGKLEKLCKFQLALSNCIANSGFKLENSGLRHLLWKCFFEKTQL